MYIFLGLLNATLVLNRGTRTKTYTSTGRCGSFVKGRSQNSLEVLVLEWLVLLGRSQNPLEVLVLVLGLAVLG